MLSVDQPKKKQPMLEQRRFLGSVEASVVGLKYRFGGKADANGIQCKMMATLLGKCHQNMDGLSEVLLKRVTNIPADANAIAVIVCNPENSLNGGKYFSFFVFYFYFFVIILCFICSILSSLIVFSWAWT